MTVAEGKARIVHANGTEDICEPGNCPDSTFGVGDWVMTEPRTYLVINSKAGRFILGPNTRLVVTKTFISVAGGEVRFELMRAPCPIFVSPPAKLGQRIARIVPRKCKDADFSVKGNGNGVEIRDDNNGQLRVLNGQGNTVELKRTGDVTRVGTKGAPTRPRKPKLKLCRSNVDRNEFQFVFCLPFGR